MFGSIASFSQALRHFKIRVAKLYYLGIVEQFEDEFAEGDLDVTMFFKFTHVIP